MRYLVTRQPPQVVVKTFRSSYLCSIVCVFVRSTMLLKSHFHSLFLVGKRRCLFLSECIPLSSLNSFRLQFQDNALLLRFSKSVESFRLHVCC